MLAGAPAMVLALAVLYSLLSGNDKAPFIVLFVLALNAVVVLALVVAACMAQALGPHAWLRIGVAAAPLIYAAMVILLARNGWLDSAPLLGFR